MRQTEFTQIIRSGILSDSRMSAHKEIAESLNDMDVSNVFIYVGDAVRDDLLPDDFKERGSYVSTIASSTHSPSSFASIATGLNTTTHGVKTFSNRLSSDTPTLFDFPSFNSEFLNSIFAYATREHQYKDDPIYRVLNQEVCSKDSPFQDLESPFISMERGPGGHAPYGDFPGTATQYYRERKGNLSKIREDYETSIEMDINWFDSRIEELRADGLLEDTLVIYTSDHGELLGEGGTLGHNNPMRPELIRIPTVIMHPELPDVHVDTASFHHVDIFPTIAKVLSADVNLSNVDGKSLTNGFTDSGRPCFWENRFLPEEVPFISGHISYSGVWDSSGGLAMTDTSAANRYAILLAKLLRSSKRSFMVRHPVQCIRNYTWTKRKFNHPSFSEEEANEIISQMVADESKSSVMELDESAKSHLQDLGYLE